MAEKIVPNGKEELTPMMKQFRDIKTQYPDAMLLFRCGDFYETYAEDAVKASKILNITLTHRSNGGSSVSLFTLSTRIFRSWCGPGCA